MTYGPYYPSVVTGDGWVNLGNATTENGVTADGPGTDLVASFAGNASEIITSVTVAVKASGTQTAAIDSLYLLNNGSPAGESVGHGMELPKTLGWIEATVYGLDLSAAEANALQLGAAFYDPISESGWTVSVDAMRITLHS